ncbi:MAG: PspC domain-containing protein [Bryobacteraceae bacterium]|nr:PspC domain-containing protein [Bryobacteraceae bacterium]
MYCTACGNQLTENQKFCPQCGKRVGAASPFVQNGPPKKLVRPMARKSIAGVCAGFSDYLGVDVVLMRIMWLCAAIFTGIGFIAYVVCWIVMPKDTSLVPVGQDSTLLASSTPESTSA